MFDSVLMVCEGNICRSPMAAIILQSCCPAKRVVSAGLAGLEGEEMDPVAKKVMESHGYQCPPHRARKLSSKDCVSADLVLVMEKKQRENILGFYPESSGKVFLLTEWCGKKDVPDPYRRSQEVFEQAYLQMLESVTAWSKKI